MIMCVTSENPIRRNIKHHDNITLDRIWKKLEICWNYHSVFKISSLNKVKKMAGTQAILSSCAQTYIDFQFHYRGAWKIIFSPWYVT